MDREHGKSRLNGYLPLLRGACALLFLTCTMMCAVAGSWQLYAPVLSDRGRLVSAVLYSTIKLFTFSPTVDPGGAVPGLYLAAVWLAPLCTAMAIFRLVESKVRHGLGILAPFFRSYTLVYGEGPDARLLMADLCRREGLRRRKVVLVTEEPLPMEERLPLERMGITVFAMPLALRGEAYRAMCFRRLHLANAKACVLIHPVAANNLALLMALTKDPDAWSEGEAPVCAVFCEDPSIRALLIQLIEDYEARHQRLPLDVKLFSISELGAATLFRPISGKPAVSFYSRNLEGGGLRDLSEVMPVHLLIAGLGTAGEAVLLQALAPAMLVPGKRPVITILDRSVEEKLHLLLARYPYLEQICELDGHAIDVRYDTLARELEGSWAQITYAAVCLEDPSAALWTARALAGLLPAGVPVAVRMDGSRDMLQCLDKSGGCYDTVFPFGMREELLTRENVLNGALDRSAQNFHQAYRTLSAEQGLPVPPPWAGLGCLARESSRAQAAFLPQLAAVRAYLLGTDEVPEAFRDYFMQHGGQARLEELLADLATPEYARLAQLAALEHRRWCVFMRLHGYTYGPQRSDTTHPCLIEDWAALCRDEQGRRTVPYDLIPTFIV